MARKKINIKQFYPRLYKLNYTLNLNDWVFFIALIENMNFNKEIFTFFNEILKKYPDDLRKQVVNKVMVFKKFLKNFFKNWQRLGNAIEKRACPQHIYV